MTPTPNGTTAKTGPAPMTSMSLEGKRISIPIADVIDRLPFHRGLIRLVQLPQDSVPYLGYGEHC